MFEMLMNEFDELIYVADIETHELLYVNKAARQAYKIAEDLAGEMCYRVLQGRDAPCPFCTNNRLSTDSNYCWDYTNPLSGRHYHIKDRLVEWEGRLARLEIAVDLTDSQREKAALEDGLRRQELVMECVRELYGNTDLDCALDLCLEKLGTHLRAERAYIFAVEGDLMHNTHEWCAPGVVAQREHLQEMSVEWLTAWSDAFARHECVIYEDVVAMAEEEPDGYACLADQGVLSLVAAPIHMNGQLVGYVGVDNPPVDRLQNIGALLQTLRYFFMLAFGRKAGETALLRASYLDDLTGLFNRNRYLQDLTDFQQLEGQVGVVYVDVNGLKDINDNFGHHKGDEVLIATGAVIADMFPGAEHYRIGGDEFVVLCMGWEAERFDRQVRSLRLEFEVRSLNRPAIGSCWAPSGQSLSGLVSQADAAMYRDKRDYYHRHQFSNRYRHQADDSLALTDLHVLEERLAAGQFEMYLQPKCRLDNGALVGSEALCRYRPKPDLLLLPGDFLPALEWVGLIALVDFFMLEQACLKVKEWVDAGMEISPISVNFSRRSFAEPNFVEKLGEVCRRYNIPRNALEIEVTESMEDVDGIHLVALTQVLRQHGFSISIDDFGTQYANLSLLTTVELDVLKLDKSLIDNIVENEKARMVIGSVVDVCNKMGVRVIAEGIETDDQRLALMGSGVQLGQGFLFGCPTPAAEFEEKYFPRK